jgi:hypothetical protein
MTHSKARQRAHTSEVRSHRLHRRERTLAFRFLSYSLCHFHNQKHSKKVVQAALSAPAPEGGRAHSQVTDFQDTPCETRSK